MAKTSNFTLGLFVTIGILLGAGAMLWWGASKYFQKGITYATYFDESVQGLQVDSSVKYRGVDVGRVQQIRVAPDNRLIAVIIKIELAGDIEKNTVAQLKAAGITGIVYVELDSRSPEEPNLSPKLTFSPEYPVIPSRPSQMTQILTTLDAVMEKVKNIDFQGISEQVEKEMHLVSAQIQQTAKAMESFVNGPETQNIMKNVESATKRADRSLVQIEKALNDGSLEKILAKAESAVARMDQSMTRVDKILAEGKVETVLDEVRGVLRESQRVISTVRDEIREMRLGETTQQFQHLAEGVDKRARGITQEIRVLSENLRLASERIDDILESVQTRPYDFIFSSPPPLRREE